jgi:NAD(P)-dependent dehydrogenase (short-subunit alcohol dehydrogenase family)
MSAQCTTNPSSVYMMLMHTYIGAGTIPVYSSSKFAVVGMHEALRLELENAGLSKTIGMTLVCPYFVKTRMAADVDAGK